MPFYLIPKYPLLSSKSMKNIRLIFSPAWLVLLFITCLVVYLYGFSEWLFFVTKPSFMSGMTFWSQFKLFLLSAFGLCVFPVFGICVLALLDRILRQSILVVVGIVLPTVIISSLLLILVDNFTYTVVRFGIVSTERFLRALYGLSFIGLNVFVWHKLKSYVQVRSKKKHPIKKFQSLFFTTLLVFSLALSLHENLTMRVPAFSSGGDVSRAKNLPNIILLGSDGLDATHLSAYGYERDTTPYIESLSADALVAGNAFPNSGTTAGSVASILSGKLPLETRVIYPPDILRGKDSYQHLPGVLKRLGYYTVDLSVPYYGDALTLNMLDGFDVANQRSGSESPVTKISRALGGGDSAYFVDAMLQRISVRLMHIFFIKPMINPFEIVIEPTERGDEQNRFDELISTLEESNSPVFVHVHMLGTHGPRFEIHQPVFSAGQAQERDWMIDYYDDSILEFDHYVGELFEYLHKSGQLQNTLVVLYSDHGRQWTIHERVPLIFWFPGGEHAGVLHTSSQNIDISPTILDYLNVPVPEWMDGQSLLQENLESPNYIFSASVESSLIEISKDGIWSVQMERASPPFYQVGYVGLIVCDHWYELYLQPPRFVFGEVDEYTATCDLDMLPTNEQAIQILLAHLSQYGFDVSSFPDSIPIRQAQ
ncbi:MAG: hypothetical protein C3F07_18690 [Anaerolineales bacterium]|nr:MAG: hypothetical protein C3F07_18690 [Anaerolineales bacterium]